MRTVYDRTLNANLTVDAQNRVRGIRPLEHKGSEARTARGAAIAFLRQTADTLKIAPGSLQHAEQRVSYLEPRDQGVEYRLSEEKPLFDSTTIGFYQTALNTPVWQAGMTVTVKGQNRVVAAVDTSHDDIDVRMPSENAIARYQRLFATGAPPDKVRRRQIAAPEAPDSGARASAATAGEVSTFLARLLGEGGGRRKAETAADRQERRGEPRLIRGRFFVYRYRAAERTAERGTEHVKDPEHTLCGHGPTLPLPPTPQDIVDGRHYLVAEMTLAMGVKGYPRMNWRVMVEVETGAVLYLRALTSGVDGLVFIYDPITSTGNPANTPNQPSAVLDPERDNVLLENLDPPSMAGVQSLRGTYANVTDFITPTVLPPTQPTGVDFDTYGARTNDFAAVNAYYHVDRFFQLVEDLGFPIATYFDGTAFPIEVEHRAYGNSVNAHCVGDGLDGIDYADYNLADATDTTNPIGIATDWGVHLHELGGHGVLYDHVGTANFGFAHSAGDSFGVIMNDPESAWHNGDPLDRFLYLPFVPLIGRRCDRTPAAGWAWGGANDLGGYLSEEILETTNFRIYRSIGGDSIYLSRRQFAARATAYLMLTAIDTLTPATNPGDPDGFADAMLAADTFDWTSEGVFGGAYNKVIRWSFEVQGLYQPLGAPIPVVTRGDPPPVDVYIDDGRAGEYQYLAVHWNTTTIWNRIAPDGGAAHEPPVLGQPNYVYVKIRNRGTQTANNIVVRGFHSEPGAGLLWPDELQPMTTPQLPGGSLPGGDVAETVVGPFTWTPVINAYGHDCLIMIVTADGDPSNADTFTGGGGPVIPEWRLVPHDNNVAQRNVYPVPALSGGLEAALDGAWFKVGNPTLKAAAMTLEVQLPELLTRRGWRLELEGEGQRFHLKPRESRRVVLKLTAGEPFTKSAVEGVKDRDIVVTVLADGAAIGGMTYRLDPEIARARYTPRDQERGGDCGSTEKCADKAQALLECMKIDSGKVKRVRVRKLALDIDMDGDCDCD